MSRLEPGSVFGRDFRIIKALRAGGMGAVYVAFQISTGKERALKVMAPALAADPATRERFVLEAQAAGRIESDHVVEIVTAGVDDATGAPYIVMELLKGEELGDRGSRGVSSKSAVTARRRLRSSRQATYSMCSIVASSSGNATRRAS